MFGLNKILGGGGLFGKFFDSIGMSWMNNVISLAANVMTGNWLAAAKDVFDIVSQFSNSWQNKVGQLQPLGPFGTPSFAGNDSLPLSRTYDLKSRAYSSEADGLHDYTSAVDVIHQTTQNSAIADMNRRNAQFGSYL
jgi:hypothetical protein